LCLLCILALVALAVTYPIEHVIVLMEENRSFDHMLGYMKKQVPEIEGLTGNESNPLNVSNPNSPVVTVTDKAPYISPYDPDHSMGGTTEGIFGVKYGWHLKPTMKGFIQCQEDEKKKPITNVMDEFPPERLPIMSTLAKEFAVFDHWFAAVPSCTCPNRYFVHSATSHGATTNDGPPAGGFPQKTIYDSLTKAGKTWKTYFTDAPYCAMSLSSFRTDYFKQRVKPLEEFFTDLKAGQLPNYTFLWPRSAPTSTVGSNDQHPDHDVALGESLMKELYEAIRVSPLWNSTLFIITYDEHGGFWDHVPSPINVPSPDGIIGAEKFDFTTLGVRIPCLMISPWINKGTIVHTPTGPTPTSQYELSSIPATIKKIFNLDSFLTKRDAWAGTFEDIVLKRTEPRTDCPLTLPSPPAPTPGYLEIEKNSPINELQRSMVPMFEEVLGLKFGDLDVMTQYEFGVRARELMDQYRTV